jgi:hypothetical protein
VRKRHFLRHLYIKCIILPRQARDEHRENSKKVPFSLSPKVRKPPWLRHFVRKMIDSFTKTGSGRAWEKLRQEGWVLQVGMFTPSCIAHCQTVMNEHPEALWDWPERWGIDGVMKTLPPISSHFFYLAKRSSYPRQARDKHREVLKKRRFCRSDATGCI